jgi:hypothetical protein
LARHSLLFEKIFSEVMELIGILEVLLKVELTGVLEILRKMEPIEMAASGVLQPTNGKRSILHELGSQGSKARSSELLLRRCPATVAKVFTS